ncbi:ferritin [candidate division KSB1 bacterium]|nr:ferritin [candidate division KSB1 bacterium]
MLTQPVQEAINHQIKSELHSAYLYLAMSAYCESLNLRGFAHWMRMQSQEELSHALKLFDYVNDRGGRVILQAIDAPPVDFKSPLEMAQETLAHERKVTAMINALYEVALQEHDYATQVHLQWFLTEQVEEEKNASEIVERLRLIGGQSAGLLMFDRELGARNTAE